MRSLAFLVIAVSVTLTGTGAAAVSIGESDCSVDLGAPSGSLGCTLAIAGGLLRTSGSPLVTVDVPAGTTARFRYDSNDRLVAADVGGDVTSYSYDETRRLVARVDGAGQVTTYTYDSVGRLVSAGDWSFLYSDLGLIRATTPTGGVVDYTHDDDGHVLSVSQDGSGERFAYDASGQVVHAEGSAGTIDYQYNGAELVRRVDSETTTQFSYDPRGRLVESAVIRGDTTRFKYDSGDSLLRVSAGNGTTRFSYDRSGRVTTIDDPDRGATTFGYDAQGHVALIVPGLHDEVVVSFNEGDPDRPLITGAVYTQNRALSWALTLTGLLRTCSRCP
jgi:YD repeat-containing protein